VIYGPMRDTKRPFKMFSAAKKDDWPLEVKSDFSANSRNSTVGSRILLTNDRVRVWAIELQPGERLGAHRHNFNYFWIALTEGVSRQHHGDGSTSVVTYHEGETCHIEFGAGEYLVHDLENLGDTPLAFVTVEFLGDSERLHVSSLATNDELG